MVGLVSTRSKGATGAQLKIGARSEQSQQYRQIPFSDRGVGYATRRLLPEPGYAAAGPVPPHGGRPPLQRSIRKPADRLRCVMWPQPNHSATASLARTIVMVRGRLTANGAKKRGRMES